MELYSTTAILLRRISYGDHDLIISYFSPDQGKISLMAKSARKSRRRFGGCLEILSVSRLICRKGRGKLCLLEESALQQPFSSLRSDIRKLSYASYWAELLYLWLQENSPQEELYRLLLFVLESLENGSMPPEILHLLFQMKFMQISGFAPNLSNCCCCRKPVSESKEMHHAFHLAGGGPLCSSCREKQPGPRIRLSKGSGRQLLWLGNSPLETAGRLRFSPQSLEESQHFLEAFLPYHLGCTPRSLQFLQQLRKEGLPLS
jgi:DNA repair protein RecO (recombination protein O)